MSSNIGRIARQRKGRPIKAKLLASLADVVNRDREAGLPEQSTGNARVSRLKRFKVISEDGDFLTCLPLGVGVLDATVNYIKVAKPYLLRRTPFDGQSRNGISYTYSGDNAREAGDGSDTEDQVIVPSYVAGDEVYAFRTVGGSGVLDDDLAVVRWVDANVDARAWAEDA